MSARYGKVAVLMGGISAEREISFMGGKRVLQSLLSCGIDAVGIDTKDNWIDLIRQQEIDRAFIVLHGRGGEDGQVQGILEYLNIPYTGTGIMGSAVTLDKIRTKWLMQSQQIATPAFCLHQEGDNHSDLIKQVGLPLIVKPVNDGSSLGITKVQDAEQLPEALALAYQYDKEVMLEAYVDGGEYTVGILCDQALPSIRIEVGSSHELYDYDAKYFDESTRYYCPSGLSEQAEADIRALSTQAFKASGCRYWGRVDFMQDKQGKFWFLEINPVPGFTEHSLVPMAAEAAGVGFDDLVLKILEGTLNEDEG